MFIFFQIIIINEKVAKGEQYLHFVILIFKKFVEIDYNIFKLVIQIVIDNECQKTPKL
jgi:hypothetical protein